LDDHCAKSGLNQGEFDRFKSSFAQSHPSESKSWRSATSCCAKWMVFNTCTLLRASKENDFRSETIVGESTGGLARMGFMGSAWELNNPGPLENFVYELPTRLTGKIR